MKARKRSLTRAKILVRRHVLLQLDGVGVPSHVIFSTRGVPRCFSVHRKRRGRVFQRHAESNFARERSSGVPPCSIRVSVERYRVACLQKCVDVGFLAGFARAYSSSIRERALSLAAGVQPDCNFRSPVSNRGSPTISKPENEGMPFKRI